MSVIETIKLKGTPGRIMVVLEELKNVAHELHVEIIQISCQRTNDK